MEIVDWCRRHFRFSVVIFFCAMSVLAHADPNHEDIAATLRSRGWIDVLELNKAIEKVTALPTGDYDCYVEGDGDDEPPSFKSDKERAAYERERRRAEREAVNYVKKCETRRRRLGAAYDRARDALNKTWLPVLTKAVEQGDAVAEVILRSCETAPFIDRTGIASDCSEQESDRKLAQARLEAINFRPALYRYAKTSNAEASRHCHGGDYVVRERCQVIAMTERYKRILEVMKSGYIGVAEGWNTCLVRSDNEELDRLAEECQRQFYLTRALGAGLPRAYAMQLSLGTRGGFPGGEAPEVSLRNLTRNLTRLDRTKFRDPDFQRKFTEEAERLIWEAMGNIERDLGEDPRWGIFLMDRTGERQYGVRNPLLEWTPP